MKYCKSKALFIENKMLFISCLSMKPLFLDEAQNGYENVLKNLFEINVLTALKLHSMLSSMYFIKKEKLPLNFLHRLILRISAKMQRAYQRNVKSYNLTENSLTCLAVGNVTKYAFYVVLKEKFSSFYADQKLPYVKRTEIPVKMLKEALKERKTFSIQSRAYQKL